MMHGPKVLRPAPGAVKRRKRSVGRRGGLRGDPSPIPRDGVVGNPR
jgi:hypothetical protein